MLVYQTLFVEFSIQGSSYAVHSMLAHTLDPPDAAAEVENSATAVHAAC
jgi:hypothetical protein